VVPDRNAIVAAIQTYCRAETENDRPAFMALFAEDIVHEDPVGVCTRRGLKELAELWDLAQAGDVDLRLAEDVIVCGNEAMAIMAAETGPADARRTTAPIVDHFVFNEAGKITSVRAFYRYA
jgi:steroid Delta-isomerase